MMQSIGKSLIIFGIIIVVLGLIITFRDHLPFLKEIGRLPGDISIKKDNFSFYFPLTTSIIISIILSLVIYIIGKLK